MPNSWFPLVRKTNNLMFETFIFRFTLSYLIFSWNLKKPVAWKRKYKSKAKRPVWMTTKYNKIVPSILIMNKSLQSIMPLSPKTFLIFGRLWAQCLQHLVVHYICPYCMISLPFSSTWFMDKSRADISC